jgi:putative ABC transport system permease protein
MHNKIKGIMFIPLKERPSDITIKVNSSNIQSTVLYITKQWNRFFPDYVINYNFYEDIIAMQYEKEQKLAKSICIIAVLAVLLCCLGLLGLVVNVVESRTREIGIRKVNGARISEILTMLNTDIIIWVVAAFLIACPIASYLMYKWLQNFAYKTELSWWVFAVAGMIAMAIALVTVSWQSYRAAVRNPVEALRYE